MAKRESSTPAANWRRGLAVLLWGVLFVSTAMAARKMQEFVATDSRFIFDLQSERGNGPPPLAITGLKYASQYRIERVFARDSGLSIFRIPLAERRRRLLAVDWVEDATVSRIWPNRLAVRVVERKPVAFVKLPSPRPNTGARPNLVDAQGVLLDEPPTSNFHFPVLSNITYAQSEAERRIYVGRMMRLMRELGDMGNRISEVNTAQPENVRAVVVLDGKALELWLGEGNYASRMRRFLKGYPDIRKRSRVTAFDLRMDGQAFTKGE